MDPLYYWLFLVPVSSTVHGFGHTRFEPYIIMCACVRVCMHAYEQREQQQLQPTVIYVTRFLQPMLIAHRGNVHVLQATLLSTSLASLCISPCILLCHDSVGCSQSKTLPLQVVCGGLHVRQSPAIVMKMESVWPGGSRRHRHSVVVASLCLPLSLTAGLVSFTMDL